MIRISGIEKSLDIYQILSDNIESEVKLNNNILTIDLTNIDKLEQIMNISNVLASFILEDIEPSIVKKEIFENGYDLFEDEIINIYHKVLWEMYNKDKHQFEQDLIELTTEIYKIIKKHNQFNLEGFLKFSYGQRKLKINEFIEYGIEQFFLEQDNEQIIDFVKNTMKFQKQKSKELHVVLFNGNDFAIITEDLIKLDLEDLKEDLDSNVEDIPFILGIITSFAPKKIYIHTNKKQNPYLLTVLINIFKDKAIICKDCDICSSCRELDEFFE